MKNVNIIKFDLYNLLAIMSIGVLGYALWTVRGFLLMLMVAIVISIFAQDFVGKLKKYNFPRIISVLIFYLITLVIFFGIIIFMVPIIINEIKNLVEFYPNLINYLNFDFLKIDFGNIDSVKDIFLEIKNVPISKLISSIGSIFGGIINIIVVFIISFYLSIKDNSLNRVINLFAPHLYKKKILSIWKNTQKKIGSWFRGQLIIAFLVVVITYVGLSILSVPYALLLSLLAGLFGLVPYGIFVAILPTIAISIIYGGIKTGVLVILFYVVVQQILDYIIQPILLKKMVGIPPLVVILSLMVGIKLFGIVGLIIAIPVTLLILEIITEVEKYQKDKYES